MINDYLNEIKSNESSLIYHIKFEHYHYEQIDNEDYIFCDGYNATNLKENPLGLYLFNDNKLLIDLIKIGQFIHEEIVKDKQNIIVYLRDGSLKQSNLYNLLINKIIDFCNKYGNYKRLNHIKSSDGKQILDRKMQVDNILSEASNIYLIYNDYTNENDWIYEHREFLRIADLTASLKISPTIKKDQSGTFKLKLNYDFENLFDIARYKLLISLMSNDLGFIGLCPYCNTFFESDRGQIYCCKSHANMSYIKNKPKYIKIKYCKYCNKPFEPKSQKAEYCSKKCKRKVNNQQALVNRGVKNGNHNQKKR